MCLNTCCVEEEKQLDKNIYPVKGCRGGFMPVKPKDSQMLGAKAY